MKKFFLIGLVVVSSLLLIGCGKYGEKDIIKDLRKKIDKNSGYFLTGELEIINNEDSYVYNVESSYKKENNFKVSLKNKINNHEQIILKNEEGVYVMTHKSTQLLKSNKFEVISI